MVVFHGSKVSKQNMHILSLSKAFELGGLVRMELNHHLAGRIDFKKLVFLEAEDESHKESLKSLEEILKLNKRFIYLNQ